MRFDGEKLICPLTHGSVGSVRLVSGTHRRAGAQYETTHKMVKYETLDDGTRQEVDAGTTTTISELIEERAQQIIFQVGLDKVWGGHLEACPTLRPSFDANLAMDVTEWIKTSDKTLGMLSMFIGGQGSAQGAVDVEPLFSSGSLVEGRARFRRFRADLAAHVKLVDRHWLIDTTIRVRGGGIYAPLLWFSSRAMKGAINDALDAIESEHAPTLAARIEIFDRIVTHNGGTSAYLHRILWEPKWREELPEDLDRSDPVVQQVINEIAEARGHIQDS